jgi:hypothetical protein
MIDEVDRRVRDWMLAVLERVDVVLSEPGPSDTEFKGVSLYLLGMSDSPPLRTNSRPPLQISLQYLVTTWSTDPEEAHRWLGQLLFAAMEHAEFQLDLSPVSPAVWAGFRTSPRPSFRLAVPCRQVRRQPVARPVLQPLVVRQSPVRPLTGRVLGPGDVPVMGARIEIPGTGQYTRTDAQGRFHFAQVPTDPPPAMIEVKARGREMLVDPSPGWAKEEEPLLIRFQLTED